MDGDGDIDAFITGAAINSLRNNRVFLNDGLGQFTLDSQGPVFGHYANSVRLGDIDGDGDLDAVVANSEGLFDGHANAVLRNDGNGNFTDSGQNLGNSASKDVELGDIDGDGDLDAVFMNNEAGNTVWINDGTGTFADSGQSFPTYDSQSGRLADYDGDGDLDLFVANGNVHPDNVWDNNGAGVFSLRKSISNEEGNSIVVGDLDGDGDLDAFVANDFGRPNRVYLTTQQADVSVTKTANQTSVEQGGSLTYTVVVRNNGPDDLARASLNDEFSQGLTNVTVTNVTVTGGATSSLATGPVSGRSLIDNVSLPNNSTITYTITATVATDARSIVSNSATVNLTADTIDPDLSNNTATDADIVVLAASGGTGFFTDSGQTIGVGTTSDVLVADFNNDGHLDAFIASGGTSVPHAVWFGSAAGDFTDSGQQLGLNVNGANLRAAFGVDMADVDRDGDLDVVSANVGQFPENIVWLNNGSGVFSDSGQRLGSSASGDVALGDLDGDGDVDIYVANLRAANEIWLNDGNGVFVNSGQTLGNTASARVMLGDFDNDGDLDAFSDQVWINDGRGNFSAGQTIGSVIKLDLGDIDNDGDLDALVGTQVWNNNNGTFTTGATLAVPNSRESRLGDLNNDGHLDVFVPVSGASDQVWLGDGTGGFTAAQQTIGNSQSNVVDLGDLDGDGDLDAFVGSVGAEPNRVWFNDNNTVAQVESVVIDNDAETNCTTSCQRSMVRKLTITFDREVTIDSGAFSLTNTTTNSSFTVVGNDVATWVVNGKTVAILTFANSTTVNAGSLSDGRYTLTIDSTKILAGNSQMAANHTDEFFRFFGDKDGDGDVDNRDYVFFRLSYGNPGFDAIFDFDGDGDVDNRDFVFFRLNYGRQV